MYEHCKDEMLAFSLRQSRVTLLRKKLPEMLISSQRTTTIFWPLRICLATIDASRPRRWPLPSMTMGVEEKVAMSLSSKKCVNFRPKAHAKRADLVQRSPEN